MIKQVIVFRTSYPDGKGGVRKLRRGKEIAQACHASIAFLTKKIQKLLSLDHNLPLIVDDPAEAYVSGYNSAINALDMTAAELEWKNGIFTKVCVKVETEDDLLEIQKKATEKGLQCSLITDKGLTEFGGVPTNTCLAIGPDESWKIDEVTGDLELY